ncbi:sigma-70 family RNA polymerase sigma factor [Brevibacillus composti]|uniref:Sigma-70 family RNA polymerase sigma factor n=1 Tax=Brevibacillus composti TaxID=2796470 RepID=A0A7T5EKL5_9BACL|nr:sigma-70 family RNA polymerase sigma factor [Brevibacillus composti]QQE74359.1 sigma-70 family RNA polymerase sigma factor [Brevibacillus composti]QUO41441.1 sigma-70 family RNA polymerase sigma factor [Brevibacillus composti]
MEREHMEQIVEEIKVSGSLEQFGVLVEALQQPIFTYCYHMLGHRQEAEDAVQEVLIKAYEHLEKYNRSVSFSAWVYKIAYHHCLNLIKRKKLHQLILFWKKDEAIQEHHQAAVRLDQEPISEPLHQALSILSPEERNLVILRVIEEKGYEELAALFHTNSAALRKKYERAIKKCKRQILSQKGGEANEAYRAIR